MWNNLKPHLDKIAAGRQAPPQGAPVPRPAAPPMPAHQAPPPAHVPPRPMPTQNPGLQATQNPGMQPSAPPQPSGGNVEQIVAQVLQQRAKSMTPQEGQTFFNGINVPALMVLKKLLPEIAPAIDKAIQQKQGGGAMPMQGGAPAAPAAPAMPPQPPMPPQQGAPQGAPPPSGLRSV